MYKAVFETNLNKKLEDMIKNEIEVVENQTQLQLNIELEYSENENTNVHHILKEYLTLMYKIVSPIKSRRVLNSKELDEKINNSLIPEDYLDILNEVKDKFESGEDVNMYLSADAFNTKKQDGLLYDWGIHHLHLAKHLDPRVQYFMKRSDYQLLFYLEHDTVHFIDVLRHPHNSESARGD